MLRTQRRVSHFQLWATKNASLMMSDAVPGQSLKVLMRSLCLTHLRGPCVSNVSTLNILTSARRGTNCEHASRLQAETMHRAAVLCDKASSACIRCHHVMPNIWLTSCITGMCAAHLAWPRQWHGWRPASAQQRPLRCCASIGLSGPGRLRPHSPAGLTACTHRTTMRPCQHAMPPAGAL